MHVLLTHADSSHACQSFSHDSRTKGHWLRQWVLNLKLDSQTPEFNFCKSMAFPSYDCLGCNLTASVNEPQNQASGLRPPNRILFSIFKQAEQWLLTVSTRECVHENPINTWFADIPFHVFRVKIVCNRFYWLYYKSLWPDRKSILCHLNVVTELLTVATYFFPLMHLVKWLYIWESCQECA